MYRYVKGEGKDAWRLIANTDEGIKTAVENGAHYLTILSVDKDMDHLDGDEKAAYKGPLYFDIDAQDEHDSLVDCRSLLLRLYKDFGVNLKDTTIHCTGSKGFHVLVPSRVFSSGKAAKFLPYTYKHMALEFSLQHLDYGIYSGGKGRMWRIENIKRSNGRYKAQLTAAQIFGLTFEEILELTKSPGRPSEYDKKDVEFSAELSAMFRRCEFRPAKIVTVADERLKALPEDPGCIKKILLMEGLVEGRRFNHLALCIAGYAKGRGWDCSSLEERAHKFIEEGKSSVYTTPRERLQHIRSVFKYVASSEVYQFACSNIRKNVNCEIECRSCKISEQVALAEYDPTMGIEVVNNCYYRRAGEDGRVPLSTFIIQPTSIIEFIDIMAEREYTIYTTLISDNNNKMNVVFTQPDWASRAALIKRLPHPDFAYIGGDTDVQKIFKVLAQIEVPRKTGVKVIGLHKVKGSWHFASREGSISANGEQNELLLDTDINLYTSLISCPVPTTAEVDHIMKYLFKFNIPEVTVPLVGWFMAALNKERIFEHTRQFPLLFIFGAAGAGKTQTILNLKRLFSLETDNIKSIADVTGFTLIKSANATNSIPLMLDEYKSTTFSQHQVKMVSKLIRAAYNNEVGERGTASQEIRTYYYRAPIILAGEQTVTEPAARDRIIEVHMNKVHSAPHLKQFRELLDTPLEKLGKLMLLQALSLSDEEVKMMLLQCQADVPEDYADRPRLNQAILLMGIRLLAKALEPYGHSETVLAAYSLYVEKGAGVLQEDLQESRKSDVDRILESISLMSDIDDRYKLANEWEFLIDGELLHLNLRLAHAKFLKYAAEYSADAEAMNYTSLTKLIRKEPYFVKDNAPIKLKTGTKLCMTLHIGRLRTKGLNLQGILDFEKPASDDVITLDPTK